MTVTIIHQEVAKSEFILMDQTPKVRAMSTDVFARYFLTRKIAKGQKVICRQSK